MKSRLVLSSLAVGWLLANPGLAHATEVDPAHAGVRVAIPTNWIDNAVAPTRATTTNDISALMAELGTQELRQQADSSGQSELAATTAIDVLRLMSDLSNS